MLLIIRRDKSNLIGISVSFLECRTHSSILLEFSAFSLLSFFFFIQIHFYYNFSFMILLSLLFGIFMEKKKTTASMHFKILINTQEYRKFNYNTVYWNIHMKKRCSFRKCRDLSSKPEKNVLKWRKTSI